MTFTVYKSHHITIIPPNIENFVSAQKKKKPLGLLPPYWTVVNKREHSPGWRLFFLELPYLSTLCKFSELACKFSNQRRQKVPATEAHTVLLSFAGSVWHGQFLILSRERSLKKKKKWGIQNDCWLWNEHIQIFTASQFARLDPHWPGEGSWWGGRHVVRYLFLCDQECPVLVTLSLVVIWYFEGQLPRPECEVMESESLIPSGPCSRWLWPWLCHLSSVSLNFHVCKMEVVTYPLHHRVIVKMKWASIVNVIHWLKSVCWDYSAREMTLGIMIQSQPRR